MEESTTDYELKYQRPDPLDIPRLAPGVEPIGGVIRAEIEDFEVEEVPLYPFSGEGEHCYVTVKKRNRTTLQVRSFLARTLGVNQEDIGFAGFKDKRAIATQTFSVLGVEEKDLSAIEETSWLEILSVTRHANKLRPGHLQGNKFKIRISEARTDGFDDACAILAKIREGGMPNYYHGQRFGRKSVGARIGCALLHRDVDLVVDLILGSAAGYHENYRELYNEGKLEEALEALPPGRATEAALLHALKRYPGNNRAAVRRIPRQLRRMYFSAYQSRLFNWALRERTEWDGPPYQVYEGDLVQKTDTGGMFVVEDLEEARERAKNHMIIPTGPMFGKKMRSPAGRPGAMEAAILEAEKVRPASFLSHVKGLKIDGTRRSACVWLGEVDCEEEKPGVIRFEFFLPPGCYATTLLDQVMGPGKVDQMVRRINEDAPTASSVDEVGSDETGGEEAGGGGISDDESAESSSS